MLCVIKALKEFRTMIFGYPIIVHTDHKNLTYQNFNTERVMQWHLVIEEYGPELIYVKQIKKNVAGALSAISKNR